MECIFDHKDYPRIFVDKLYTVENLPKLIDKEKELKEIDELFLNHKSSYPYNPEESLNALKTANESYGGLKLYEGFFLWFSEYYCLYDNTVRILMTDNCVIPVTWKYYLAIMAVSTIRCEYLLKSLEIEFLLKNGDERWLQDGLSVVPEKIKKLEKINNILAHQPWKLKTQDINDIYSKYDANGWNLIELVQAVLILTNYHRLATISLSMKSALKEEPDDVSFHLEEIKLDDSKLLKFINEENVKKKIISELEIINQTEEEINPQGRKFSEDINNNSKLNSSFESANLNTCIFTKHISSFCTVYLDFDSHSEEFFSYLVRYNI